MGKVAKLDEVTAGVLRRAEIVDGVLRLPDEQLKRELYVKVNKALVAIGCKWNRKAGGHLLGEADSAERLAAMLATGSVPAIDKLGYFPTPAPLVNRLLELAEVRREHSVLEPSAGRGAISSRLLEIVPASQLHVVELQQKHADVLAVQGYKHLRVGDFMETDFPCKFDRIVMNPPFERLQDIDHVTRAFDLLAPGGRLVSVMATGTGTRRKVQDFLSLCDRHGFAERNPTGAFKESGTSVHTLTVVLDSPRAA
jgi:predicted RNA methylase